MRYIKILPLIIMTKWIALSDGSCEMYKNSVFYYTMEQILYRYITCTQLTANDDINKQILSTLNTSCKYLEILKSSLPEINKEMFVSLNFTQITIDAGVQIIQEKTFERCNISAIIIDNNGLRKIKDYAFKSFSIDIVSMQNNYLTEIGTKTFAGAVNLRKLNLRMNNITSIEVDAFKDLVNLQELNLSSNNLKNIVSDAFKFLINLRELDVSNNILKEIEKNLFINNKMLQHLDIHNNSLSMLDTGYFPKSLEELKAEYNKIVFFNISNLPRLISVNLDSNKISKLSKCFNNLPALNILQLSNNYLGKSLSESTTAFSVLTNLSILELDNNNLKYFNSSGIKNINTLEGLSLANNYLTNIDFSELPANIKILNVSQNFISELKKISKLSSVLKLEISYNNLSQIDYDSFTGLNQLQGLYLSHNSIKKLSLGCFRNLKALQQLDLSYNQIADISAGVLNGLDSITELDLSHNQLSYLNEDIFHNMKILKHLNIAYNDLTNVNIKGILVHDPWLRSIDVNGNNWSCKLLINLTRDHRLLDVKSGDYYNVSNVYGIPCNETTPTVVKSEDDFSKVLSTLNIAIASANNISVKISVIIALIILILILMSIKFIFTKYYSQVTAGKQFIYQKSGSEPEIHLI